MAYKIHGRPLAQEMSAQYGKGGLSAHIGGLASLTYPLLIWEGAFGAGKDHAS